MAVTTNARIATCVVAAAIAGAVTATLPAEARAGDGSGLEPTSATAVSQVDAGAALAEEASAAVGDVAGTAVEGVVSSALDATTTDATASAPPAPDEALDPVETTAPDPAVPVEPTQPISDAKGDTSEQSGDTTSGIGSSAAPPAPTAPRATQATPTNVSVSVRIGSPGDGGPVTQVNLAAVSAPTASPAPAAPAASATPTSNASTAAPAPRSTVSAPSATTTSSTPATTASGEDDIGTWNWQWDCVSAPDLGAISRASSTGSSVPDSWTWIWNCGDNSAKYQTGTASQYQPSNVNVSIRISSPGNDGPVSQSNVAVAAGADTTSGAVRSVVDAAVPSPITALPTPIPALPAVPLLPRAITFPTIPLPVHIPLPVPVVIPPLPGLSPVAIPGITTLPEIAAPWLVALPETVISAVGLDPLTSLSEARSVGSVRPQLPRPPRPARPAGRGSRRHDVVGAKELLDTLTARAPLDAPGAPVVEDAVASERSAATGDARGAGAKAPPAPRWKAPARPTPAQETAPSGTSAAPATGGGSSSGGGIPIFLALPFLAAMLDLARRVMLDRVTLPSGSRSRVPERPG